MQLNLKCSDNVKKVYTKFYYSYIEYLTPKVIYYNFSIDGAL